MSGVSRNLMGPYPRGVPTPRSVHVHPYPTRFHGSINTRPTFSLPFQYAPHAVFKPDDFSRSTDGLGTLQYDTGRGIFRPGGDGGGIFDGNIAGLGGRAGLGALPWRTYSSDTLAFQKELNQALRDLNVDMQVDEDGYLGDETCSAARKVNASPGYSHIAVPSACNTTTTTATPVTIPQDTINASLVPGGGMSRMSSTTKNALIFFGAGAVALGAAYVFLKKKG